MLAALAFIALPATATTTNYAPKISGAPPREAIVDRVYTFQPTASDANGDTLRFTITGKPAWATFNTATGKLAGTPSEAVAGAYAGIAISVSDGRVNTRLAPFSINAVVSRKAAYGHYIATHRRDTPADVAMICGKSGVKGVVWRRTWAEVEPSPGVYDFSSFDSVLQAIAASNNPNCRVWIFIEFKSFSGAPVLNPCPPYLQGQYSGPNLTGGGATTCFMWDPVVVRAYSAMMQAAAARFDLHPRVEGLILQESALGFDGVYNQDVASGGTYTPEAWRDGLIALINQCSSVFKHSRCMSFLNFIRGNQAYLYDVSSAISAVPDNRACMSGPDLLPANETLYKDRNRVYEVLTRHEGCRSNSAQNDSYEDPYCGLSCIFRFGVSGTFGDFDQAAPRNSGVCVNSYLFWNHREGKSPAGWNWLDALSVIAANPYGTGWLQQCVGGGGAP